MTTIAGALENAQKAEAAIATALEQYRNALLVLGGQPLGAPQRCQAEGCRRLTTGAKCGCCDTCCGHARGVCTGHVPSMHSVASLMQRLEEAEAQIKEHLKDQELFERELRIVIGERDAARNWANNSEARIKGLIADVARLTDERDTAVSAVLAQGKELEAAHATNANNLRVAADLDARQRKLLEEYDRDVKSARAERDALRLKLEAAEGARCAVSQQAQNYRQEYMHSSSERDIYLKALKIIYKGAEPVSAEAAKQALADGTALLWAPKSAKVADAEELPRDASFRVSVRTEPNPYVTRDEWEQENRAIWAAIRELQAEQGDQNSSIVATNRRIDGQSGLIQQLNQLMGERAPTATHAEAIPFVERPMKKDGGT